MVTLAILILAPIIPNNRLAAADNTAWFWCTIHHTSDGSTRNFYSNVFKGVLSKKNLYEPAFRALVATRVLKKQVQGDALCLFDKERGEARRQQNEYALERYTDEGGTIEFIDWSY